MKIGLIGTGLMGQALAQHLLAENQSLIVYNRSSRKNPRNWLRWALK